MTREEALGYIEAATRRAAMRELAPQRPTFRQSEFLALLCKEALFGGAAGGGKSSAILLAALQFVHVPGYAALILRRTYADLALSGAIMDRAKEWLAGKAHWSEQLKTFSFASGATLTFGYLENERDKYRYQGSNFDFIAYDELTQFTKTQYLYLFSRLRRSATSDVPLRMRAGTNPGGIGHDWVHQRFLVERSHHRAFVPARIEDNPHLDQDSYRESLAELDSVTRAQLERGEWIRDGHGLLYRFEPSRNLVADIPGWSTPIYAMGIDFGASETKPTTAIVITSTSAKADDICVVHSEKLATPGPSDIAKRAMELFEQYEPISLVVDAGALGKGYLADFQNVYGLPATAAEKANKLGYRKMLNGELEKGKVTIWEHGNPDLLGELGSLQWNSDGTDSNNTQEDHLTDALLYSWRACRGLAGKREEPLPRAGTEEYYQRQEALMEEEDAQESEAGKHWWEQGL